MEYPSLYWEDVEEGQVLPPVTDELSLLRLVAKRARIFMIALEGPLPL